MISRTHHEIWVEAGLAGLRGIKGVFQPTLNSLFDDVCLIREERIGRSAGISRSIETVRVIRVEDQLAVPSETKNVQKWAREAPVMHQNVAWRAREWQWIHHHQRIRVPAGRIRL